MSIHMPEYTPSYSSIVTDVMVTSGTDIILEESCSKPTHRCNYTLGYLLFICLGCLSICSFVSADKPSKKDITPVSLHALSLAVDNINVGLIHDKHYHSL